MVGPENESIGVVGNEPCRELCGQGARSNVRVHPFPVEFVVFIYFEDATVYQSTVAWILCASDSRSVRNYNGDGDFTVCPVVFEVIPLA